MAQVITATVLEQAKSLPPLLDARGLSRLFGRTHHWLYTARKGLEARGFPPPLLKGRWAIVPVLLWLAGNGDPETIRLICQAMGAPTDHDPHASARAELEARLQGGPS